MALTILIRGQLSSVPVLSDECFTKANFGVNTNDTLSINTPRGVLGGSVAAAGTADYTVAPFDKDDNDSPIGLFVNDAAGAAFENSPAVASGKVAIMKGMASVEVDVYETRNAADTADLTYTCGDFLYGSANGFLTNEFTEADIVIGVVTKTPTTSSPTLGLDMRI